MKKNPAAKSRFVLSLMGCLIAACCLLLADVYADTHTAAGCSQSDVQSAIDAASDGDIVMIPSGSATWSTQVNLINKEITIQGAGMGQTTITDGTSSTGAPDPSVPLRIAGEEGKPWRVTGITFIGKAVPDSHIMNINGTCKNFRIDHCKFTNTNAFTIFDYTYGLIDHCTFYCNIDFGCTSIYIGCDNATAWERPLTLGTSNAVYVEDCYWSFLSGQNNYNTNAIHGMNGARYVYRYNTMNTKIEQYGCTNGGRAPVSGEVYENKIFFGAWTAVGPAGGTGVYFNNTFGGTWYNPPLMAFDLKTCPGNCCCSMAGRCDGTDPLDGNLPGMMGYPCIDQVGRGPGFEVVSEITVQKSEPAYEWNNTWDGNDLNFGYHGGLGCTSPSQQDHVQEGRDFYNDLSRPGYVPYVYPHPLVTGEEPPPPPPPDTTPPSDIASVNDGTGADIDSTLSTTQLSANWTPSTDGESDISKYWYAIGTVPGGTNTVGWASTSNGTVTSVTRSNLSLTTGVKYYFTVKAENGAFLQSNPRNSDGQVVVEQSGGELDVRIYPSPYSPSKGNSMRFSIEGTGGGEVRIYTLSGRLVKELAIGEGESEQYSCRSLPIYYNRRRRE
jgi:hypothetical protein